MTQLPDPDGIGFESPEHHQRAMTSLAIAMGGSITDEAIAAIDELLADARLEDFDSPEEYRRFLDTVARGKESVIQAQRLSGELLALTNDTSNDES